MSFFSDDHGELKTFCPQVSGAKLWYTSRMVGAGGVDYPIAGVTASVETAGSLAYRRTATRNLLLLGKSKKVDTRESFILVEGPTFQQVLPIKTKDTEKARAWCAKLNTAAKKAAS